MRLYIYRCGREGEEQMTLNEENNSNEEPSAGAVAIQIVLCNNGHAPPCYRISRTYQPYMWSNSHRNHPTLWPHNGSTNPQSHCCDFLHIQCWKFSFRTSVPFTCKGV